MAKDNLIIKMEPTTIQYASYLSGRTDYRKVGWRWSIIDGNGYPVDSGVSRYRIKAFFALKKQQKLARHMSRISRINPYNFSKWRVIAGMSLGNAVAGFPGSILVLMTGKILSGILIFLYSILSAMAFWTILSEKIMYEGK